jgi:hypothetical protein
MLGVFQRKRLINPGLNKAVSFFTAGHLSAFNIFMHVMTLGAMCLLDFFDYKLLC